jgi:transcriptional regulator with XRE-family HTH domain
MDSVRFGLNVRALRHRRGWTQAELGHRAGLSQSAISRIERGEGDALSMRVLGQVAGVMGARIRMQLLWQGEELDRLVDGAHARLVERVIAMLVAADWQVAPEVTYHFGSERGSIDVLAFHPPTRDLLVVEVKSVVPDMGAMLAGLDRKGRVAAEVARERGWNASRVSRLLVLGSDRTARRRFAQFAATFATAYPVRTRAVGQWIGRPDRAISGVMFVPLMNQSGTRPRFRVRRAGLTREGSVSM